MIYLDHNATTPLCPPAREAMEAQLDTFGNPSSVHAAGRAARAVIDESRDRMAALLRTKPGELVFTGGGTEANNLAVLGLARAHAHRGRHLVCATTEHHAVLHPCQRLAREEGFELTLLPVERDGRIDPARLREVVRDDTILVSIMLANNETGVTQPLADISAICRARGALLHSDLVQAFGKVTCDLELVDAASFAAHKFYGPKGAGLLFLRAGIPLEQVTFGGSHENERRPGTENVAALAGMAAAAGHVLADQAPEQARLQELRDTLWHGLARLAPEALRQGSEDGLQNTLNVVFPGRSSETMLMALDLEGICASSGSACMVGSVVPSHVLLAMGLPRDLAASALRFSLGCGNSRDEMEETLAAMQRILERLPTRENRGVVAA